jgi:outer membrane protein assembly factor BamD
LGLCYFDILKLQYPASIYADDAQYYLAEINFKKGEFVLAAYNYNYLRRAYPNSEFYKEAMFKTALSYYELSPTYDRDQEYTFKAIQAFAEFQAFFPQDSLSKIANEKIIELRDKLGHREFFTAELYRKLYSPRASLIYYDAVIEDYPDTKYYELAYVGKIEVLYELFRYDEALGLIKLFRQIFPNSSYLDKIKSLESSMIK